MANGLARSLGLKYKVYGLKRFNYELPYVVLINHQSHIDIFRKYLKNNNYVAHYALRAWREVISRYRDIIVCTYTLDIGHISSVAMF